MRSLTFYYILMYCSYSGVAISGDVMNFEFNLFFQGEYFKILVYYSISIVFLYQKINLFFIHCTVMFFNKKQISYYITFCFCLFFTYSFHEN